jgi:hypothetical protein
MTDRLTPGMLRDLANLILGPSPSLLDFSVRVREEAARREAEASIQPTDAVIDRLREGPGSADATIPPPIILACAKCDWKGCDKSCIEDKPAPAADDLVERLRGRVSDSWEICEAAADRIEAQEIAIQAAALEGMETGARRLRDERDALKARVARLTEALSGLLNGVTQHGMMADHGAALKANARAALAEANDAG